MARLLILTFASLALALATASVANAEQQTYGNRSVSNALLVARCQEEKRRPFLRDGVGTR